MLSGGRPAVSTTLWVPSCDSRASIFSANSRLPSLLPWLFSLSHSAGQNNAVKATCLFSSNVFPLHLILIYNIFSHYFPTSPFFHHPAVSSRSERQLALGKPVRGRTWRPPLPLLSDLAEHATALHRPGSAPRGQRGQVSSGCTLWFSHIYWGCRCDAPTLDWIDSVLNWSMGKVNIMQPVTLGKKMQCCLVVIP